ncbi:MAG: hypothetical protein ABIH23_06180 [bacterium]
MASLRGASVQRGHMGGTGCRFLIAFLAVFSASSVYSADRTEKPINLNGIEIDVATLSETKSFAIQSEQTLNPAHALIQFNRPTSPRDRKEIEKTGIQFLHYVPTNAYIISGPIDALIALRNDKKTVGVVSIPAQAKNRRSKSAKKSGGRGSRRAETHGNR